MSKRATDAAFDALHAMFVEAQTEELARELERARKPRMIPDPDKPDKMIENPEWSPLSPKLLGVIRATLKDNGIDVPATSKRFDSLVEKLGGITDDDLAEARFN